MFFRKPGLPILMVRMPDGTEKPYWNTFYQQVDYPCPDARELVSELGMQYRSACVLTESLRISWRRVSARQNLIWGAGKRCVFP